MGARPLGWAAGSVPWRGEAEHGGGVLGELLQARDVAHVHAVLEVGPHRYHADIVLVARLPCQELHVKDVSNKKQQKNEVGRTSLWQEICDLLLFCLLTLEGSGETQTL